MGQTKKKDDKVLTQLQAKLIVALHDTDLNLSAAAKKIGVSPSNAAGKVQSVEHHTGVDIMTLHGLSQLYDPARALVERWEGRE